MNTLETPRITLMQIVASVVALIALGVAFGLPITKAESDAIVQFITVAYPIALAADALIRHGRTKIAVAQIQSQDQTAILQHENTTQTGDAGETVPPAPAPAA